MVVAIPVFILDINDTFAGCATAGLGQWSSAQQGLKDAMALGGGCEDYLKGTAQDADGPPVDLAVAWKTIHFYGWPLPGLPDGHGLLIVDG